MIQLRYRHSISSIGKEYKEWNVNGVTDKYISECLNNLEHRLSTLFFL